MYVVNNAIDEYLTNGNLIHVSLLFIITASPLLLLPSSSFPGACFSKKCPA